MTQEPTVEASPKIDQNIDQLTINTLRFLAVDMVEKANSGHPGAPMGLAPLAYTLWTKVLRHDPAAPDWPNRDRFVLSCGHASALLYGLLHLAGFDLPMEELKSFRQLGSRTPGHPEFGYTEGVETTTGPLGQGLANAVGMAIAERLLAARFNRPGHELFSHRVWVIASDGDIMEGITSEASSMAGHFRLGHLNVFYDDNNISIDGSTDLTFSEDVAKRYEAYGWHVQRVKDGNDVAALKAAAEAARAETDRPSLVVVRTHIGYGSPHKQDSAASHGSPLGADEVRATKENLGWPLEPTFLVPERAREAFRPAAERGAEARKSWEESLGSYAEAHPELAAELDRRRRRALPDGWDEDLPRFSPEDGKIATRKASGKALNALAHRLPELVGGSADLAGSNNTTIEGEPPFSATSPGGRNFHFGIREHAMGAAMNGMSVSGMLLPYGGTFLIFSDYFRPSIRLAALMEIPAIYVLTHDSIFLGEDGPTHQPISQLASLRSIPHLVVIRPADANETAAAWAWAVAHRSGPVALSLTRQGLPILEGTAENAREGVARGAYVIWEPEGGEAGGEAEALILATGSEVAPSVEAAKALADEGRRVRVVSMPSWEIFEMQSQEYRDSVLPPAVTARLAVEAAVSMGWHKWVGSAGRVHAQDGFGASAPAKDLAQHFGFHAEEIARQMREMLGS